jgi:hypothetical protein
MLWRVLSAAVVFGVVAAAVPADDAPKKPEKKVLDKPDRSRAVVAGKVKKVDADKGILVVTTKKDDKDKDVEIKIDEDTQFRIAGREEPLKGKDGLKAKELSEGVNVQVITTGAGKQMVMVGGGLRNPSATTPKLTVGKVKKVDEEKGVLVLTVGDKEKEVKIDENVDIMVFGKTQQPKKVDGKTALKEVFKTGTMVRLMNAPNGKTMIMVGSLPMGPLSIDPRSTAGKIKKVDAEKGTLVVTIDDKDEEIKPGEETKFMIIAGRGGPKVMSAKEALKRDEFKPGAQIRLMKGPTGHLMYIVSAGVAKKPAKEEEESKKPAKKDE